MGKRRKERHSWFPTITEWMRGRKKVILKGKGEGENGEAERIR